MNSSFHFRIHTCLWKSEANFISCFFYSQFLPILVFIMKFFPFSLTLQISSIGVSQIGHFLGSLAIKVMNLGSNTFGNPFFSKGLTKLAILPNYRHPLILCLAFRSCQKLRKSNFQSEFLCQKSSETFWHFFQCRIILVTSILKALYLLSKIMPIFDDPAKLCKAMEYAYNQGVGVIL